MRSIGTAGALAAVASILAIAGSPGTGDGQAGQARAAAGAAGTSDQWYDDLVRSYLDCDWAKLTPMLGDSRRHMRGLKADQRADVLYIREALAECRPPWWKYCQSTRPTQFPASIWGKRFVANFKPADKGSVSGDVDGNRIAVTLSWDPSALASQEAIWGPVGEQYGIVRCHDAEFDVWRNLGYNYLLVTVPAPALVKMHTEQEFLYNHLQDFFARMTALYYSSPRARLAGLIKGGLVLDAQGVAESTKRSHYAISVVVMNHVLEDPGKWPSFSLPLEKARKDPELTVVKYLLENLGENWTLAEDRALREIVGDFMRATGGHVYRTGGEVPLPNGHAIKLIRLEDTALQQRRDEWIVKKLAGRT